VSKPKQGTLRTKLYVGSAIGVAGFLAFHNGVAPAVAGAKHAVTTAITHQSLTPPSSSTARAEVIAYTTARLGAPYVWGGTGPYAVGYDCSGLMMNAFRSVGIPLPRTSQEQFAWGPQIPASDLQPGDLVFFAGSDGTPQAPGHVGLYIGGGRIIQAYVTGTNVMISTFGTPGSLAGLQTPVGYTDPFAHAGASP
jgi:cell wall-associated NlpC family hydrolase